MEGFRCLVCRAVREPPLRVGWREGDGAATSHTYYNLTPAIEYDFSVSTRASDGRLSRAVSVIVETDYDIFCEWFERFACSVETPLASFGDGVCIVGRRIEARTYLTGTPGDAPSCEWGRVVRIRGHRSGDRGDRRFLGAQGRGDRRNRSRLRHVRMWHVD